MNLKRIIESYGEFCTRFNIKPENEEAVFSVLTSNGWNDFTAHPGNFGNLLEDQIKNVNGQPYHIYRATGTFKKGSMKLENGKIVGRNSGNLERIVEIPLDADYINYLCYIKHVDHRDPRSKQTIEKYIAKLRSLSNDELTKYLRKHLELIMETLTRAGIPYSEITYSGYGFYVKIYLPPEDQRRIPEIRDCHKDLVSYLNDLAGFELFDRQCTDAGTRVTRIEGSYNLKNSKIPRLVRRVKSNGTFYKLDNLLKLIPRGKKESPNKSEPSTRYEGNFPRDEIINIVNPFYTLHSRQNLTLSLTGFIAKEGGSFEDTEYIVKTLAKKNEDNEIGQRIGALKSTFKKFKEGKPITGYKGLESILPPDDLKELKELFGTRPIEVEAFEDTISPQVAPEFQFPLVAFYGFFERYRKLMEPTTEAPPSFHFGAISTILGAMLNRSVYINYGNAIYANQFVTLIGRTGVEKKDTAINRSKLFFRSDELIQEVIGTGSAEGLLEQYMDMETEIEGKRAKTVLKPVEGRIILFTEYELARFLAKSVQKGSNLLTTCTQLYDCPDEYSPPTRNNRIRAIRPALSILTGSTLAGCEKYLTDEHVQSGFLNRFMFFIDETNKTIPIPPKPDKELLQAFRAEFEKIIGWAYSLEDKEIKMSAEAKELWEDVYIELQNRRKLSNPLLADMWSRIPNHIWKIAMLYAVSDQRQVISLNDLELAVLIGDYFQKTSAYLVRSLAKSKTTKIEEYILNKLKEVYPRGLTKTQVHNHVGGRVNANALGKILEGMERMNLIRSVQITGKDRKERPGYVGII